jgi:hypothetical protein
LVLRAPFRDYPQIIAVDNEISIVPLVRH